MPKKQNEDILNCFQCINEEVLIIGLDPVTQNILKRLDSRLPDCVTIVIARSEATKQSLKDFEKQEIATPPSVARDDKIIVTTQSVHGNDNLTK